jgi:hypothetical protein
MNIEWPNDLPEAELPTDLTECPFYNAVKVEKINDEVKVSARLFLDVAIPLELLNAATMVGGIEAAVDGSAEAIISRMLADLKVEILPLLRRRITDALES